MPFDFQKYDAKCAAMSPAELQLQWEHYTRLISGAATSTAVSGVALPLTMGVSVVGVALAAPAIHNARKKREIIEKHLNNHGTSHVTRKRDVLTSVAISGTIGVVTMGASTIAADAVSSHAAEYGIQQIVESELAVKVGTHIAFDAAAMAGEHAHTEHKRKKEALKAQQQGLIPPPPGLSMQQEMPPDGFYPAVPIPQAHSTFQNGEPVVASNSAFTGPSVSQDAFSPPPQYPGLPSQGPFAQQSPEKKNIIFSSPPPQAPESDSKYKLVVVSQPNAQAPPSYFPPPSGAVHVSEKMGEQVYQTAQTYPQQHYPPPPIQTSTVTTYPSYPGTMMVSTNQGPSERGLTDANMSYPAPNAQPLKTKIASNPEINTEASVPSLSPQPQSRMLNNNPTMPLQQKNDDQISQMAPQPRQDSFPPSTHLQSSTIPPPPPHTSTTPFALPNQNQSSGFVNPPLQHQTSFPPPTLSATYPPSYPPPPPQPYQPVRSHPQHPSFPPNSFPPPPPPSNYPVTPAQTPGASFPQYIPAQHASPVAYPTGYPTPIATPYAESADQIVLQQYMPEKPALPQYQEVPIPGPQILSQQGQYLEQQQQQYQYQYQYYPSGYPNQPNMYRY